MKNAFRLASFALAVSACSQGALPSLPNEATEPVPTTIRLVGAPPQLAAGAWANMRAQVLDQFDEPLAGQTIALAVRVPEGESPGLVPGLGNSCSTGSAGEACSIALESKGPMGRYTVALTSGPIQAVEHVIEVTPAVEDAELSFQVPGRPGLRFRNGDRDLLAFQVPVNLLASGDPVTVDLRLTDRYGNPVPAALAAEVLAPAGAPSGGGADAGVDAGAAGDGGEAMDGGAAADAAQPSGADSGALMDVQTPSNDAAPADAGAAADATAGLDAGGEADAEPTVRLAVGTDCEQAPVLRAQAMPDAQGRLRLCLWGTGVIGAGRVAIRVPGVLRVDDGEGGEGEALTLPTNTLPSGRVRLSVQGQPQPALRGGRGHQRPGGAGHRYGRAAQPRARARGAHLLCRSERRGAGGSL